MDLSGITGVKRMNRGRGRAATIDVVYAKQTHRASMDVSIEKKDIDGSPTVVYRCNSYYPAYAGEGNCPPVKEFTDVEFFKGYVSGLIETMSKAV